MALNFLLHENVGVPCSHYFDDFTVIVPETLGGIADELTGQFFKELGWEVKRGKDKLTSDLFTALGVNFDLARAILGSDPQIVVKNKESRIEEICLRIHECLQRGEMKAAEATELRGKLIFSNSQTYGKMGALAYYQLGLQAKGHGSISRIGKEVSVGTPMVD